MKVWLGSSTECMVDGVGLLRPGEMVLVDIDLFKIYHGVDPARANFSKDILVTYEIEEVN